MKRSQREAVLRGSTHLLRLSLPAVRSNGAFEGADILGEAGSVPAAVLYPAYRSVMTWALTPAAEHAGLFPPGAGDETRRLLEKADVPRELAPALETLCEMLDDPLGADASRISDACLRIGEWADRRGDAPATALRFLQAAATCSPNDARVAYRAGYVARRQATWDLAELWFRHGVAIGRRSRDWEAHATAYLGLGNNYYLQGRYALARREHSKALRVSKRHGLQELQGRAYHDLLAMAIVTGDAESAEINAQRAFRAYGPQHSNIPTLAHDIAYFWHEHGQFSRALRVFRALLPHFKEPERRMLVLGSIGRAAAECGENDAFEYAWGELSMLAERLGEHAPHGAPAMLHIARGAVRLQDWSRAESAVRYSLRVAELRNEVDVISEAEQLLDVALSRAASELAEVGACHSAAGAGSETLADELVSSLTAISNNL